MRKTNKIKNANAGQVSIEALLLWAALAGMLALFTPAFAHAMDAYSLLAHTNQFTSFSGALEKNISWLSFSAPGSRIQMDVPALERMEISVFTDEIEIIFDHESFTHAKTRTISSVIPLEGEIIPGKSIILTREEGQITIQ